MATAGMSLQPGIRTVPGPVGDTILVGNEQLTIAGLLKYDPFSGDGLTGGKITLITSGETFTRLTGITDYSLIMIQTTSGATDEGRGRNSSDRGAKRLYHER